MVDVPESEALDRVMDALANSHRRAIVHLLGLQPWAINRLAEVRGLSLPAIHKHLKVLDGAGLIRRHKRGRTTYLTLDGQQLREVQQWVGQFHTYWGNDEATYENYDEFLGIAPGRDDTRQSRRGRS